MADRNTVQLLAALILAALTAACASSGAIPKPFPGATGPGRAGEPSGADATPSPTSTASDARFEPTALVQTALGFQGVPYRSGGTDPSGFDCSGFVQYVFAQHGLDLPRSVREQYVFGDDVAPPDARAGDLIYFQTEGTGPSHVGLVVEGDRFVHAPSSRGVVRVERFSGGYWAHRLVAIKRLR